MKPTQQLLATALWTATALHAATTLASAAPAAEEPGAIAGTVVLASSAVGLEPRVVENTTDPEICGPTHSLEDLELSLQGGIAHVILRLVDVPADRIPTPQVAAADRLVLDNRDCRFAPHTASITAGTVLELRNSDPTLHTVHWYGPSSGNVALPKGGSTVDKRFSTPGLYPVKCDVHGWMQAFVLVVEHPFHTVSDSGGSFRIAGVPPGSYTLEAWHERFAFLHQTVEVSAGETVSVLLTYDP